MTQRLPRDVRTEVTQWSGVADHVKQEIKQHESKQDEILSNNRITTNKITFY